PKLPIRRAIRHESGEQSLVRPVHKLCERRRYLDGDGSRRGQPAEVLSCRIAPGSLIIQPARLVPRRGRRQLLRHTHHRFPSGGGKDAINFPSVPSQTRSKLSCPPAMTIFPSGVAAADSMKSFAPLNERTSLPSSRTS